MGRITRGDADMELERDRWTGRTTSGPQLLGAALLVAAMSLLGCAPPPDAPGPTPIGTNQSFRGLVNGAGNGAIVTTFCPGPTWPDRRGPAVEGQTVSAVEDPLGPGNTGDNGAVFVLANSSAQFTQLRRWDEPVAFPTDVDVPCDGPGTVVFDPCVGFVGCRGAAEAHTIRVTFRNIAL